MEFPWINISILINITSRQVDKSTGWILAVFNNEPFRNHHDGWFQQILYTTQCATIFILMSLPDHYFIAYEMHYVVCICILYGHMTMKKEIPDSWNFTWRSFFRFLNNNLYIFKCEHCYKTATYKDNQTVWVVHEAGTQWLGSLLHHTWPLASCVIHLRSQPVWSGLTHHSTSWFCLSTHFSFCIFNIYFFFKYFL